MSLSFHNPLFWESLHLRSGLEDCDMAEELKLSITTEDFPQEPGLQPHLWLWVKPSLVCPIPARPGMDKDTSNSLVASVAGAIGTSSLNSSWDSYDLGSIEEDRPTSPRKAGKLTDGDALYTPAPQEMPDTCKLKAMLRKSTAVSPRSVKRKCPRQRRNKSKEAWPCPPLSSSILISLALCNSPGGSLTVQQIYQFTRQHFPFFQTAPGGWRSAMRQDLCSSSCFEKNPDLARSRKKHKSCLWKLTPKGHRRFQEGAQALPAEALDLVRQSMSKPDLMRSLFGL